MIFLNAPPAWLPLGFGFCLVFLLCVVVGFFSTGTKVRKKRQRGSRSRKYARFRRRALHYNLVKRCRSRVGNRPRRLDDTSFPSPRTSAHRRWRRRNIRARQRMKKRRTVLHEFFLSNNSDGRFNLPKAFSSVDVDAFLDTQSPLDVMISINGMKMQDHVANVKKLMARVTRLQGPIRLAQMDAARHTNEPDNYYSTPLIYDTGASFGLTPYRSDFIDFEEASIPVKDISKTNTVLGIGTVMYKLKATNGDELLVPGLSYYLPECDIRLMSPQVYHKLYGGCSIVDGEKVDWRLNKQVDMDHVHRIEIPMDKDTNLPMMFNVSCTDEERATIGPHFSKACAHLRHARGFFFGKWSVTEDEVEYEFDDYMALFAPSVLPCVTQAYNQNLSSGQKALLMWHFRLGISVDDVQQLMKGHTATLSDGSTQYFPPVIPAKPASAATCPLPPCPTCKISSARKKSPPSPTVGAKDPEKVDVLAKERYMPGDFVSSDQFKVPVPGRRLWGYGKEKDEDLYNCGTVFHDMASSYIWMELQSDGSAAETLLGKIRFEDYLATFGVSIKHLHSDNGIYIAKKFRDDCSSKGQKQTFSGVGAQF